MNLANITILVTGATGMIGTSLIDTFMELNKDGRNIVIIAIGRSANKARERFWAYWESDDFIFVEHDVNQQIPSALFEEYRIDCVIHGASTTHPIAYAREPIETITANILGAKHLLDYAVNRQIPDFVFLSSVEIYGENRGDIEAFDESYCGYLDCNTLRAGYPESKRVTEALCQAYRKQYGIRVLIPRLSRVYGPTMQESDSKAVAQFIKKAVLGEDIVLKSSGNQLYSYTYVTDAAEAILKIMEAGADGEAYNIADSQSAITLKEMAHILAEISHTQVIYEKPNETEKEGYSKAQKALLDTAKIEKLGWHAKTPIKEGLEKTVLYLTDTTHMRKG